MVNAAKRMRALTEQMYSVRNGAGSITYPKDANAQLSRIYLRIPTGTYPNKEFFSGARDFWRQELRRLKYWNPAIKTEVETLRNGENEPMYLTVEYTSPDRNALSQLKATPFPVPQLKIKPASMNKQERIEKSRQWKDEMAQLNHADARKQPQQGSSLAARLGIPEQCFTKGFQTVNPKLAIAPKMTPEIISHAPKDEVTVQAQPAVDASTPQTTSPPKTIYSRSLTLPVAGLRHQEIWNWVRQHTGLLHHRTIPPDEMREYFKLQIFNKQAAQDRARVKAGIDAMKKEEAELKKARANSERMAAEAM